MGIVTAIAAGAAVAGTVAAGAMSANAQNNATNKAASAEEKGAQAIQSVDVPSIDQQMIQLQQLKLSGSLTPEQESQVDQQMSQLKNITTDPTVRAAQMGALAKLQQVGDSNGLTVQDRAQLNEVQNASNQLEQSNRNAILQNAQQRGMAGSGLEQAAELVNNQSASTNAANTGFQTAANAQARALQAITQAGQMGTQIQGQDFSQQATVDSAQDAINKFNAANSQAVQQRNTDRSNVAQQDNLQRQDLQDTTNNQIANQEEVANKGLYQQQYADQMQKAQGEAAAYTRQAQNATTAGQNTANTISAIGSGVGKIGTTLAAGSLKSGSGTTPSVDPTVYSA